MKNPVQPDEGLRFRHDQYLKDGNEARIRSVYDGRDPRMEMNFIVPYGTYKGGCTADCYTYTLRWPYIGSDAAAPFDLRTDTNDRYYYLWRKFVIEGRESRTIWDSDIDIPIFRYADAPPLPRRVLERAGQDFRGCTFRDQGA